MDKAYPEQLVKILSTRVAVAVTKPEGGKRGRLYQTTQSDFPGLWGMNVRIIPKESLEVSEEEDNNDETMEEGGRGEMKAYGYMGRTSLMMTSGIM